VALKLSDEDVSCRCKKLGSPCRFRSENLEEGLVGDDLAVLGRSMFLAPQRHVGGNNGSSSGDISLETWDCNDFLDSADIRREDGQNMIRFTVENASKLRRIKAITVECGTLSRRDGMV
jgi:hypothetical protein